MKQHHRPDLFGWSVFDPDRDIDFHSVVWVRKKGNVVIDPLPMSDHDRAHLESLGGAALVYTEMTCVSPEGRITPGCTGMYTSEHEAAWKRVVDFIHRESPAKVAMQLGHSGPDRKSTRLNSSHSQQSRMPSSA